MLLVENLGHIELEDGVLIFTSFLDAHHSPEMAERVVEKRIEMYGTNLPFLVDIRKIGELDFAARQYYAQDSTVPRLAILVGSKFSKTIADFFLGLNISKTCKVFTKKRDTIIWLKNS